jgi:hypothetical protein
MIPRMRNDQMGKSRPHRLFYIAGCARSGTTLLLDLMPSFKDTHALTGEEHHFGYFSNVQTTAANLVLKREANIHQKLANLPPEIQLIYLIRHPFDTLTSHHPNYLPHRRFHVSERRWRDEYAGLKRLRAKQPGRVIRYVRYCDLVRSPDVVQRSLATSLDLEINRPFSEAGVNFFASSIGKYRTDHKLQRYLWLLPNALRQEIKEFCEEFGYELPVGYVQRPWLPADITRRLWLLLRSRNWLTAARLSARDRVTEFKRFVLRWAPNWFIEAVRPVLRRVRRWRSQLLLRLRKAGTGARPLAK